jgi:hypothetical protein
MVGFTHFGRLLLGFLLLALSGAVNAALAPINDTEWDEAAVRRVLQVFAYGGLANDAQIGQWADLPPQLAIDEILRFDVTNEALSPGVDTTSLYGSSLEAWQNFLLGDSPDNFTCPSTRTRYRHGLTRNDGNFVPYRAGLQQSWLASLNKRGLNPFRQLIGFWLVNYHMAVNLSDTEPQLIRALYDDALSRLAAGDPFSDVLATGARSAAVAREYGHRSNKYNNNTGVFTGNDDFAREFHQLFFQINGLLTPGGTPEDPNYHEDVDIEHTAWLLTGMNIDRDPLAYGYTLSGDQWIAPLDFSDHTDAAGRNLRNFTLHYNGDLEIYHTSVGGQNAGDKIDNLAAVAIMHPESLDNIPVSVVNFFADDNLTTDKIQDIRETWRNLVGQPDDFVRFLRAYAISTTFHRADTYKYKTAFIRNLGLQTQVTVDNEEAYWNTFSPLTTIVDQGAEPFVPAHDVFGGQTSLNAANNRNIFTRAYNVAVDDSTRFGRVSNACRDRAGTRILTWVKDWARIVPQEVDGSYRAGTVGEWLWHRLIADGGENYGALERAFVVGYLSQGKDFPLLVAPANPGIDIDDALLAQPAVAALMNANEAQQVDLGSATNAVRREANRRVGLAVNFISMTPFAFAIQGPQPQDADGDGVGDTFDQCPATPAGETVDGDGCSDSQLDGDGDGVSDAFDLCPGTPTGESVDGNGCGDSQLDGDGDGVNDALDQCPATPASEIVDVTGCGPSQRDTDGDGVSDNLDQCANTPTGEVADVNGCGPSQRDGDSDGISDDVDLCPNSTPGAVVGSNGCVLSLPDTDGDGVSDGRDACPATPPGDPVDTNGCATSQRDGDLDGVTDDLDICPTTAPGVTVDSAGCPFPPLDSDGDGVIDSLDSCPGTPTGTIVNIDGCADGRSPVDDTTTEQTSSSSAAGFPLWMLPLFGFLILLRERSRIFDDHEASVIGVSK